MERIVFIGPGRAGLALGQAFALAGGDVELSYQGRRLGPPDHPVFAENGAAYHRWIARPPEGTTAIFLSVPDSALPEVASELAGRGSAPAGCVALHCSGAIGPEALAALCPVGYQVGTFHPFQALSHSPSAAARLKGGYFAVSGDPEAVLAAGRLVAKLDGHALAIPPEGRALYHAAAVMGSNYLVGLFAVATGLLRQAGVSPEDAEGALAELVSGTLANIRVTGPLDALTGPIVRGDMDTVSRHLAALPPGDAATYVALGRSTVALAKGRLPAGATEEFEALFARFA